MEHKFGPQRAIDIPSLNHVKTKLVEGQREGVYCISVQDTSSRDTQSMIIAQYRFAEIFVSDMLGPGKQTRFGIMFTAGWFSRISVSLVDNRLMVAAR